MAATREEVENWMEEAKKRKATHLISVCDRWNYEDYPVYVLNREDLDETVESYNRKEMQSVNEVITIEYDVRVSEGVEKRKKRKNSKHSKSLIFINGTSQKVQRDADDIFSDVVKELNEGGCQSVNTIAKVCIAKAQKEMFRFLYDESEIKENKDMSLSEFFDKLDGKLNF